MPKLKTLGPRLPLLDIRRAATLPAFKPGATPRKRGRQGVKERHDYLRMHPLCAHCARRGITRAADVVDHVTPLADGGADDETNKQGLCTPCHDLKTAAEAKRRGAG